ncbi:MAG TPA: hypothetical protein VHC43_04130 [Mycobacteriales bacterium]|nr:hypothetical protein [Mycobacteriales bacterium]
MSVVLFGFLLLAVRRPVVAIMVAWVTTVMQASVAGLVDGVSSSVGSAVRLIDEPLLLTLFLVLLLRRLTSQAQPRLSLAPLIPAVAVLATGAASSLVSGLHGPATLLGVWYALKFWLILAVALLAPLTASDLEWCYRIFRRVGVIVAISGLLDFLAPHVFRAVFHTGSAQVSALRGSSVQGFFVNPGEFSTFMSLMFAVTVAFFTVRRRRSDIAAALLFLILSALSLRLKSVLSPLLVIAVLAVAVRSPGRRGLVAAGGWLAVAGLVLVPVYGQILEVQGAKYTSAAAGQTPRGMLYSAGWHLAKGHFPLGTGFGTFGEDASRRYYSPIYTSLGWNDIHGLSPKFSEYLTDTSWPAVYTELGLVGAAAFVVGMVSLLVRCRRAARSPDPMRATAGTLALAALVSYIALSLGSPMLFNSPQTVLPLALVAMAVGQRTGFRPDQPFGAIRPPVASELRDRPRTVVRSV